MRFYLRHNYKALGRILDDAVADGEVRAAELTITTLCKQLESELGSGDWAPAEEEAAEIMIDRAVAGYGRRFRALLDACPAAFGALTQLTMETMENSGSDLRAILTTCTRLEKLSLDSCRPKFAAGLWRVRHARLREITISLCHFVGVDLAWLPRLEHFVLFGWFWTTREPVSFGHVPRLTKVKLANNACNPGQRTPLKLSHILRNIAISHLHLNFDGADIWVQPEISRRLTDVFCNLRSLNICNVHRQCGLTWTMFLLQSAQHLQRLYIDLVDHECAEQAARKKVPWEVDAGFKHYSLVSVMILGFLSVDETMMVEFILCLVETAVILEEICISEDPNAYLCERCGCTEPQGESRFPQTDQDKDAFSKRIKEGRSTATFKMHIQSIK
ncbi:hypothetical protein BS78_07G015500 [Paspalum vaginatum]|nr:hypothetical protein BS78_07G015500 [Paspalum vaginatum]